jgi:hypothetical protein
MEKFIVTLPGYDALSPTLKPEQCAVHSDYSVPKISPNTNLPTVNTTYLTYNGKSSPAYNFGWVDVTFNSTPNVTGTYTLFELKHGLPNTPASICQVINNSYYVGSTNNQCFPLPCGVFVNDSYSLLQYYVDATKLNVSLYYNTTNSTNLTGFRLIFKYYIYVENGL